MPGTPGPNSDCLPEMDVSSGVVADSEEKGTDRIWLVLRHMRSSRHPRPIRGPTQALGRLSTSLLKTIIIARTWNNPRVYGGGIAPFQNLADNGRGTGPGCSFTVISRNANPGLTYGPVVIGPDATLVYGHGTFCLIETICQLCS
jgi:hypothetical protein